jgi:hypothetical protein
MICLSGDFAAHRASELILSWMHHGRCRLDSDRMTGGNIVDHECESSSALLIRFDGR